MYDTEDMIDGLLDQLLEEVEPPETLLHQLEDLLELTEQQYNKRMSPAKELTVAQLQDLLGYNIKIIEG